MKKTFYRLLIRNPNRDLFGPVNITGHSTGYFRVYFLWRILFGVDGANTRERARAYALKCACVHMRAHACTCVRAHVCTPGRVHLHTCMRVRICVPTCTYARVRARVCASWRALARCARSCRRGLRVKVSPFGGKISPTSPRRGFEVAGPLSGARD